MSTVLGIPTVPLREPGPAGRVVFGSGHHFRLKPGESLEELVSAATAPLSVVLQVTERASVDRGSRSQALPLPDPMLDQLEAIRGNLAGTPRVFLGGEPLLRRDFCDIVDMYRGHIVGVSASGTRGMAHVKCMTGRVTYVSVGLAGPRSTTHRMRGDYDHVMAGVREFQDHGIPLSLTTVVYRSTVEALPYTCQIADVLGAGKVTMVLPLRNRNAGDLAGHALITEDEAARTFDGLAMLRAAHGWRPALRMTIWNRQTEGHKIVVDVEGNTSAWPVYDGRDLREPLGNLLHEPIAAIWRRYRFKHNHFATYMGASIRTVERVQEE
jgi:MoaA/NifB/PqqE/SkfB family radical SAM enzyme